MLPELLLFVSENCRRAVVPMTVFGEAADEGAFFLRAAAGLRVNPNPTISPVNIVAVAPPAFLLRPIALPAVALPPVPTNSKRAHSDK